MSDKIKITNALISVSDKTGLDDLAKFLFENDINILSTGGTAKTIRNYGVDVTDISEYTGFPEIMSGRVKTLHPKVHGGLLALSDDDIHLQEMQENDIQKITLAIVNLYPFIKTVRSGAPFEDVIENIDIGGPSMIRSAAKNYKFTTIITDPSDYPALIEELRKNKGTTTYEFRRNMAAKAFSHTAFYDSNISNWFTNVIGDAFPQELSFGATLKQNLRYGENPHQNAAFYSYENGKGIAAAKQLQGKELSYNNINDANAALEIVNEFSEPAAVIIKHANPCGAAVSENIEAAYDLALSCDPVSAFGGIMAFNRKVEEPLAKKIANIFVEAIIAPDFSDGAKQILSAKKNTRVLLVDMPGKTDELQIKSVVGGFLVQQSDQLSITKNDLETVTKTKPTKEQIEDMLFAFRICKHVKSNAIVIVKNKATVGIGAGQMSRVDASNIAAIKAASCNINPNRASSAVLASDAFFPFADGVEMAAKAGIKAIIQPGGSIRDNEVIEAAEKAGIAMVFTGKRHFKH